MHWIKIIQTEDRISLFISLKHIEAEQNVCYFSEDMFKCIFLNENVWIPLKISLMFVPKISINYILALVQIVVWRRPGDKLQSELMMVSYKNWPRYGLRRSGLCCH